MTRPPPSGDITDLLTDERAELSNPHPLFDVGYYLQQRPDLRFHGAPHPLQHYLLFGAGEGVNPHPMFHTRFYLDQCSGMEAVGRDPLGHYLREGWKSGLDPHPLFSTEYYLRTHPEIAGIGFNPLLHAVSNEVAGMGDVSPWFDGRYYQETNPDLIASDLTPMQHYFRFGIFEGRVGSLLAQSLLLKRPEYRRPRGILDLAVECRDALPGIRRSAKPSDQQVASAKATYDGLTYRPPISLLIHVQAGEDDPARLLHATVNTATQQTYLSRQVCIVIDADVPGADVLAKSVSAHSCVSTIVQARDDATVPLNLALAMATGHYVGIMRVGDQLQPLGLGQLVAALQDGEVIDLVYGDHDEVGDDGTRGEIFFKPGWSPDYLLSNDYLTGLALFRRQVIQQVGGFRGGVDAGYDLALRARHLLQERTVRHVPIVVCSARKEPPGRALARRDDGLFRALAKHVEEQGLVAEILPGTRPLFHDVILRGTGNPLISVVIPTANASFAGPIGREWTIQTCIAGLREKTSYKALEVVVVHDGNLLKEQEDWLHAQDVRLVRFDRTTFNFSRKINLGVAASSGEYVLLLNDDMEPKRPDWLEIMLGYAQQPGVGVVGAKLFFPNGRLQHTGIVMQDGDPGHLYYRADGDDPGLHASNAVARNHLAVTGACQLVSRSVFDAVSGYDETLPLNFNDVDFCLRVRDLGLRMVCAAAAELYHFEGVSKEIVTGQRLTMPSETKTFRARWRDRYRSDPFYHPDLPAFMPQGWVALDKVKPTPRHGRKLPRSAEVARKGVTFMGPVDRSSGLGTAARGYVGALIAAGMDVNIRPMDVIYGHQAKVPLDLPTTFQDFPITLVQANADATPAVVGHYHEALKRASYRIGVWVWELPAASHGSFDALRHYDEIWVPSEFNREAYQALTRSPVNVMPYPVCGLPALTAADTTAIRERYGVPASNFVFLYMFDTFSLVERKNPFCLMEAFEAEFGGRSDVTLMLKVSYYDNLFRSEFPANRAFLARLGGFLERCTNVRLVTDILPVHDLYSLINAADCYVSPHRSEGFGLTVAEAMYYGKPVIATDFSGTRELVTEATGLPLRFRLTEIESDVGPYVKGNVWADPSVDHLRELLLRVVEDRALCRQLGEAAARHIRQQFTAKAVGQAARERLNRIAATL